MINIRLLAAEINMKGKWLEVAGRQDKKCGRSDTITDHVCYQMAGRH